MPFSTRASCEPVHSRERVLHLLRAARTPEPTMRYAEFLLLKVPPERLCGRRPSAIAAGLFYQARLVEWCAGLVPEKCLQREAADLFDTSVPSVRAVLRQVLEGLEYKCGIGTCTRKSNNETEASRHRFHQHGVKDPGVHGCVECRTMFSRSARHTGEEQEREHLLEVHITPPLKEGLRAVLGREPNLFEVDNELRKMGL